MDGEIVTLHQFMLVTKGWLYVLMVAGLLGLMGFWCYLSSRDGEE